MTDSDKQGPQADVGTGMSNPHYEPMLQFFEYGQLPPELRIISAPFSELADLIVKTLPRNPERTVALRKLIEANDCAVRARRYK